MAKTYTFRDKGTSISFTEGEHYYITDYFPIQKNGKYFNLPVVIEAECRYADYEEEMVEFYLYTIKHIIPSDLPLGSYEHPSEYVNDEWDNLFHDTVEKAFNRLEEECREDKKLFFTQIFDGVER